MSKSEIIAYHNQIYENFEKIWPLKVDLFFNPTFKVSTQWEFMCP
jgi:hypothetical protein